MTLLLPLALTLAALGGLVLVLRGARRRMPRRRTGARRGVEVLDRVSLGPRQGVAVVRLAGRIVMVSQGDGGVHAIAEIPEAEWQAAIAGPAADDSPRVQAPARPGIVTRTLSRTAAQRRLVAPRLWRGAALGLALALAGLGSAHAQTAPDAGVPAVAGTAAEAPAGASTSTGGLLQALPPLIAQDTEEGGRSLQLNGPVGTALLLGIMALLPTLLLLATGFTRILIVLHLLKQALGAQAVPPTHLVNALALLLTLFLMAPTLDRVSEEAIDPWLEGEIDQAVMFERSTVPFRDFMLSYADEDDIVRFIEMRGDEIPPSVEDVPLTTIVAAFTTSELRRAFQLGFVLFLPFIVIDLVVASVLMSMGMFMLPPVMISLPFKLLLFVLADGWSLVIGGLLSSFL